MKVKIEFDIEGDEPLTDDEVKEMVYSYLTEAMEIEELEYTIDFDEDDDTSHLN